MAHIFLSYSRNDGYDFVTEVQIALQDRGYETWRDIRNLRPDQDFTADIEKAIENASHVVVCVTPDSKRDDSWVRREIQYALAIKKPVIPLRCADILPHLAIINNEWVDYFANRAKALYRLGEILTDARLQNRPGEQPEDRFRSYLENALKSIVSGLQQRIIRQIDLFTEIASDAVKAPHKPPDIFEQFFSGVTINDGSTTPRTPFDTFAEAFRHYNGRVLLLGAPGAGKTITLMAHARNAITARLEDPEQPLPLLGLIPLWDAEKQPPLAEWLAEMYNLDKSAIQKVVEQGKAMLLLDGLDELGRERTTPNKKLGSGEYDPRMRFIKALPANNQILVTSRIEDYSDMVTNGDKAELNGAVILQPISEAQMAEYLADQPELLELIRDDPQLQEITKTPLLMSFFAFAYRNMNSEERLQLIRLGDARDLRDRIFLGYIEKRYIHEQEKVKVSLPSSLDEINNILGWLSTEEVVKSGQFLLTSTIHYKDHLIKLLNEDQISAFLTLMCRLQILIYTKADHLRFVHLLLRDSLAFKYSLSQLGKKPKNADDLTRVISALGYLKDIRAVDILLSMLNDQNTAIRAMVAFALGRIQTPRAVEPLILILNDADASVRAKVAYALGQLQALRAVEPLILMLNDPDASVRMNVTSALGNIEAVQAVEPLILILNDPDTSVRMSVASALGKIGDTRAVGPLIRVLKRADHRDAESIASALFRFQDDRALKPLLKTIRNSHGFNFFTDNLKRQAQNGNVYAIKLMLLARKDFRIFPLLRFDQDFRSTRAVEILLSMLKDKVVSVRANAAVALGEIKDTQAVEPLIASLKDRAASVRASAASSLGIIGDARAVEPLISALKDRTTLVRTHAAGALGNLRATQAVEPLLSMLDDPDVSVRARTALALEQLKDIKAVEPLVATLDDPDASVRANAASALGEIKDTQAVAPLISTLKDKTASVRASAAGALGNLRATQALEPLLSMLNDPDASVRASASSSLGKLEDRTAVESLIRVLEDEDEHVRYRAVSALGQIGDVRAVEPLTAMFNNEDVRMYDVAVSALKQIGDESAVEPLITALKDTNTFSLIRRDISEAIEAISTVDVIDVLIDALAEEDELVLKTVGRALANLLNEQTQKTASLNLEDEEDNIRQFLVTKLGLKGDLANPESALLDKVLHDKTADFIKDHEHIVTKWLIKLLYSSDDEIRCADAVMLLSSQNNRAAGVVLGILLSDHRPLVRFVTSMIFSQLGLDIAIENLKAFLGDFSYLPQEWGARKIDERYCDFAAEILEEIGTADALATVNEWRQKNVSDWRLVAERGETYRLMGRYNEALADFIRAIEINPQYVWALTKRGQTYQGMERYDDALADFNYVLELAPNFTSAILRRAETYALMNRVEEAETEYTRLIEMESGAAYTLRNRAGFYLDFERLKEAEADLNTAEELQPDAPYLHYHHARLHVLKGEPETAIDTGKYALEREDPLTLAHVPIALAQLLLNDMEASTVSLNTFIAETKDFSDFQTTIRAVERFLANHPELTNGAALLAQLRAATVSARE